MMLLLIATSGLLAVSCVVFQNVLTVQDKPYMDEIFHVPQAQKYCAFNFSYWDPMLTTLPGLYLSSMVILFPFAILQNLSLADVCTTRNLRACNLLYLCGNVILLYLLSKKLNDSKKNWKTVMLAVTLALMPVSYFFTWLYYTDPGSTFFTLLMYLLCLRQQNFLSAVIGAVAIFFRQTNVIWVVFCLLLTAIEILHDKLRLDKKVPNFKKLSDWEMFQVLIKHIFSGYKKFFSLIFSLLRGTFWYIVIISCFISFVFINGGIVVGDRTHHEVSANFPQIFYFSLIASAFSFPHIVHPDQIGQFFNAIYAHPIRVNAVASLASLFIKHHTYEHKYLLSDNRHYTFYVWSKFYRRYESLRYYLILAYMYGIYQFYKATVEKGFLWRVTVSLCIAMCLVPQSLLEFRYFIIPFYIIRLNMKHHSTLALVMEFIIAVCINLFTIYMFIKKPFYWLGDRTPQRFMW